MRSGGITGLQAAVLSGCEFLFPGGDDCSQWILVLEILVWDAEALSLAFPLLTSRLKEAAWMTVARAPLNLVGVSVSDSLNQGGRRGGLHFMCNVRSSF